VLWGLTMCLSGWWVSMDPSQHITLLSHGTFNSRRD
jgi:hypothetical protein